MNKSLQTLFLVNTIFVFAASLIGPLYAIYTESLGTGIFTASLTWSVMLVTTSIATILMVKFGDRVREKEKFLIIGFVIRCVAWFGYTIIHNLPQLILIQILVGVGEAIGSPAFDAIFANNLNKKIEMREFSDWRLISNLVAALATGVGGIIVAKFGFNILFYTMSSLALVSTIIAITRTKHEPNLALIDS